jgi:predicted kinase
MKIKIGICDDCKCAKIVAKDYYGAFNLCEKCFERLYSDASSMLKTYSDDAIKEIQKYQSNLGTLYMMCGVPGSGKSTWVKNHIPKTAAHISRDTIRFSKLKVNDDYFSKETEVFDEFCSQIKKSLEKGIDVYADATHLNASSRAKVLNKVKDFAKSIEAICIEEPVEICLERNRLRAGLAYVPPSVIRRMFYQYTRPEHSEGFSNITVYGSLNN